MLQLTHYYFLILISRDWKQNVRSLGEQMFAKKENKIKAQLSSSFSQEKHSYKPTEPVEKFNICLRLTLQAFQLDWINLDFTR